jgi:hypothetical protein
MSMSRKALKLVQKALPHLRLCKDKLVLPPTEHILRGYSFERTPYKGAFYLWRLVLPLYCYRFHEGRNYSTRIPRGDYVHLSQEAPDRVAAEVMLIISKDILNVEEIRTPLDFLGHVGWMIGNHSPTFLLDLAVTYFLVGRIDPAVASLRQAVVEADKLVAYYAASGPDRPVIRNLAEIRAAAAGLAQQMEVDPTAATQTISEWEQRNISAFELGGTVVGTPPTKSFAPPSKR